MGNSSSKSNIDMNKLIFLRVINEQLKIMQDEQTKQNYLQCDQFFHDQAQFEKTLQQAEEINKINHPYLLNLIDFQQTKEGTCCAGYHNIKLLFEFSDQTLSDYNLSFQNSGKSFLEADLWYIILQTLKAIKFYELNIPNYSCQINSQHAYVFKNGSLKYNDCVFYHSDNLENNQSQAMMLNQNFHHLNQFQVALINLGFMILESANLSCRATSKLIITNTNELLSLKQNYSEYLGDFVESLINVKPEMRPRFFLENLELLRNQQNISVSDQINFSGNQLNLDVNKKNQIYPYTQQFEIARVNDLQFHHQFKVNKMQFNELTDQVQPQYTTKKLSQDLKPLNEPMGRLQVSQSKPEKQITYLEQVPDFPKPSQPQQETALLHDQKNLQSLNKLQDDQFLQNIDRIIENSKQITQPNLENQKRQTINFSDINFNPSDKKPSIPQSQPDFVQRQNSKPRDSSVSKNQDENYDPNHTPIYKMPKDLQDDYQIYRKKSSFDDSRQNQQSNNILRTIVFFQFRILINIWITKMIYNMRTLYFKEQRRHSENQKTLNTKSLFKIGANLPRSVDIQEYSKPSRELNHQQTEHVVPLNFQKNNLLQDEKPKTQAPHEAHPYHGDPNTQKLLERADQVLSNSNNIMSQLKSTKANQNFNKKDYESKIDRMLSQSPKRKKMGDL